MAALNEVFRMVRESSIELRPKRLSRTVAHSIDGRDARSPIEVTGNLTVFRQVGERGPDTTEPHIENVGAAKQRNPGGIPTRGVIAAGLSRYRGSECARALGVLRSVIPVNKSLQSI